MSCFSLNLLRWKLGSFESRCDGPAAQLGLPCGPCEEGAALSEGRSMVRHGHPPGRRGSGAERGPVN